MFFIIKKKTLILYSVVVAALLCTMFAYAQYSPGEYPQFDGKTVIIDPGHGGIDGGAVGKNGSIEKDLNLALSLELKEALVNNGLKIVREKAGISKPLSTHIARHTFARLAKEVHTDNSLLQGLLMHSSVSTTEQYMGRFSTSARDEALKEIFKPLAPEMMHKKDLLDQLAELSVEELEGLLKLHNKNKN